MPAMPAKMADRPDESCPVCKQSTYLNPNMKFKINPECYHRMCDSCIDRIFASGPAPCPVAGCKKTLRKAKFRTQTFGDLRIERECDIRKRVNGILNKREEDFETLRDFNDYQEKKEDLCWKLINNEDVASVEKQLVSFERDNKESILANMRLEAWEREAAQNHEEARVQRAAASRAELKQELADERAARGQQLKGVIDSVMDAKGDPEEAARRARERVVKERSAAVPRKERGENKVQAGTVKQESGATENIGIAESNKAKSGLAFAGMRKKEVKEVQGPYDPFDGVRLQNKHYTFRTDGLYTNNHVEKTKNDTTMLAGGFSATDYFKHALFDAHAGLGINLSKEKAQSVT